MDISILICTHNRARDLQRTLSAMGRLVVPTDLQWEILVVDNNSTDDSRAVILSFEASLPIRYQAEQRQGKSYALNRGVAECRAPLILMTDDDVDVDPNWMAELWRAACAHSEAAFFGGKILPLWEKKPPGWMIEHSKGLLVGITMDFTMGDEEMPVEKEKPFYGTIFFGANLAYRREAMLKVGPFREDLGPHGRLLRVHEETEYMKRLLQAGYLGLYVPGMLVRHRNPPQRGTESYMLRWFAGCAAGEVRMGRFESSPKTLFSAPIQLWRQLAEDACNYLARRWKPSAGSTWVPSAVSMARMWGAILEFRRVAAERGCLILRHD